VTDSTDIHKRIFEDAPRFDLDDSFQFACHPGVPCFNECCGDITIVLTPYCVVRLKQRLGISSEELHKLYTLMPFSKEVKQPVPILKMGEDEGKKCPFVGPDGCTVYEDRPWACRMYPVGLAAPRDEAEQGDRFYFLLAEDHCKGFAEDNTITIREWLDQQGVAEYDEAGEWFKPVGLHEFWDSGDMSPAKMDMFFAAAYDLDRFRRFVFGSTFLDKFDVPEERVEQLRTDDLALMRFGFQFIQFAVFGEADAMTLNAEFDAVKKREKEFFERK